MEHVAYSLAHYALMKLGLSLDIKDDPLTSFSCKYCGFGYFPQNNLFCVNKDT